jgi:hypothetical protein
LITSPQEVEVSEKKDPSKSPRYTNGPVVKTGPSFGQNRSRNNDGRWHRKRSDAGHSRKKSGCFITTAVCEFKGLPDDCLELRTLRAFRDQHLLSSAAGRALVAQYYAIAPAIAERLTEPAELERVWLSIQSCMRAIESERFGDACREYQTVVQALAEKLLKPRA